MKKTYIWLEKLMLSIFESKAVDPSNHHSFELKIVERQ